MSYLDRLKAEISGKCLPSELTKPTKAPSDSFVSGRGRHISEIEAANDASDILADPATEARRQCAELQALIDKLAEKTGHFTEADKLEALEVALRAPDEWLEYLPLLLERCAAGVH